jgi:hypothetical protein
MEEAVELGGVVGEAVDVGLEGGDLGELESPLDPAEDGRRFVMGEVDPVRVLQISEDGGDALGPRDDAAERRDAVRDLGAAGVLDEDAGHLARGEDMVDDPGVAGAPGHSVEIGAGLVLAEDEPARVVDIAEPPGPVAAGAREDNADGLVPHVLGEGAEEDIDGEGELLGGSFIAQEELPARDNHLFF